METPLVSTATVWVSRGADGTPRAIPVREMEDSHLWRWIRYFRRKFRNEGFEGSDDRLDRMIQDAFVTGPAIYREAAKRGLTIALSVRPGFPVDSPDVATVQPVRLRPKPSVAREPSPGEQAPGSLGSRRITLDEDE
jgi:hypothetical protein